MTSSNNLRTDPFSRTRFAAAVTFASLITMLTVAASAQQDTSQQTQETHSASRLPQRFQLPATTIWKFGIQIEGAGDAKIDKVTFPLPVDWPDQTVEVLSIDASENVKGQKIKKLGSDASQMFFKVPRLAAGEVAEVFVTMKINKPESNAPEDTSEFVFAKKITRKLRGYLSPSPYIESKDDRIVEVANALPVNEDDPAWKQVETIYTWVRENIDYKFDTEIQSCLTALDAGHGDCEELSSMFVALCRARGIPARAVWIPEHTYPEFYLEDAEGKGHWFPCQCAGSYAFGHMPEAKPILSKGDKFKVSGHPRPLRYIQPTMKAFGTPPQWGWKMEQVKNENEAGDD